MIRAMLLAFVLCGVAAAVEGKPRLLVLTDVGADPDDQQSLVRLMLYANEFGVEGLIATSAGTTGGTPALSAFRRAIVTIEP
jgi:hypothetical protein